MRSQCTARNDFKLWPNPVQSSLQVQISTDVPSPVLIQVLDTKGRLVHREQSALQAGVNQFVLPLSKLPSGTYIVNSVWANGLQRNTTTIIKQ